jgi:hypothetical protein
VDKRDSSKKITAPPQHSSQDPINTILEYDVRQKGRAGEKPSLSFNLDIQNRNQRRHSLPLVVMIRMRVKIKIQIHCSVNSINNAPYQAFSLSITNMRMNFIHLGASKSRNPTYQHRSNSAFLSFHIAWSAGAYRSGGHFLLCWASQENETELPTQYAGSKSAIWDTVLTTAWQHIERLFKDLGIYNPAFLDRQMLMQRPHEIRGFHLTTWRTMRKIPAKV